MIKTIIIGIIFAIVTLAAVNKICFAMTYNQMDGTVYPVKIEGLWAIEEIPDGDGYKFKPFECKLITDYTGDNGIQIKMTSPQMNGEYELIKIKYGTPSTANDTYFYAHSAPFKQPLLQMINEGCSKYLDGDKCDNSEANRPLAYIACHYTS